MSFQPPQRPPGPGPQQLPLPSSAPQYPTQPQLLMQQQVNPALQQQQPQQQSQPPHQHQLGLLPPMQPPPLQSQHQPLVNHSQQNPLQSQQQQHQPLVNQPPPLQSQQHQPLQPQQALVNQPPLLQPQHQPLVNHSQQQQQQTSQQQQQQVFPLQQQQPSQQFQPQNYFQATQQKQQFQPQFTPPPFFPGFVPGFPFPGVPGIPPGFPPMTGMPPNYFNPMMFAQQQQQQPTSSTPSSSVESTTQQASTSTTSSSTKKKSITIGNWSVHTTQEGAKYYYNNKTKTTQWTKPIELMTKAEQKNAGEKDIWEEFKTDSGQIYYFNTKTGKSSWTKPGEEDDKKVQEEKHVTTTDDIQTKSASSQNNNFGTSEVRILSSSNTLPVDPKANIVEYPTEEEAIAAFKALLRKSGVRSFWKWETALPYVIHDKDYKAIKTLSQRKIVFKRYQEELIEMETLKEQEQQRKIKEDYLILLKECKHITPKMSYREALTYIDADSRFSKVSSSRDREHWFHDYIDELRDKERIHRAKEKRRLKDAFISLLETLPSMNGDASWHKIHNLIREEECYNVLSSSDLHTIFEDVKHKMRVEERKKRLQARETFLKVEKDHRSNFRKILSRFSHQHLFHSKSRWRNFFPLLKDDTEYQTLIDASKKDMEIAINDGMKDVTLALVNCKEDAYDSFCNDLNEELREPKKLVRTALTTAGLEIQTTDTIESLTKKLIEISEFTNLDSDIRNMVLYEMIDRVVYKQKQNTERFLDLLKLKLPPSSVVANSDDSLTWASIHDILSSHSAAQKLNEENQISVFESYVANCRNSLTIEEKDVMNKISHVEEEKENMGEDLLMSQKQNLSNADDMKSESEEEEGQTVSDDDEEELTNKEKKKRYRDEIQEKVPLRRSTRKRTKR